MKENKLPLMGGALLWFGAAVSIAEILTGALLGTFGLGTGLLAIFAGHLIGCTLFYFVGLLGAKSGTGAMEGVGIAFGRWGSVFFSVLNVLQLVGWTAVMILNGANAMGAATGMTAGWVWCAVIGLLIAIWVMVGIKNVGKLNLIAVGALLVLSVVLGVTVFSGGKAGPPTQAMSFGLALELSIAMPLSWLPLIADYTKNAGKPVQFTLVSTLSYFGGSALMYCIGLGAALFAGNSDIVAILSSAGLGIAAILIVILSTVTTTFLDVYSAGESLLNIVRKWNPKAVGVAVCAVGTAIAIFTPVSQYESFLTLIGSVFVPMASIMIADYFLNRNTAGGKKLNAVNAILWVAGFGLYRLFLFMDFPVGSTIPVVVIVMALSVLINIIRKAVKKT